MADVRLTATNPEDSSVVPVACDASGRLLLEEQGQGPPGPEGPQGPKGDDGKDGQDGDPFSGNFDGDVTFGGSATFAGQITAKDIAAQQSDDTFPVYRGLAVNGATTLRINGDGSGTFGEASSLDNEYVKFIQNNRIVDAYQPDLVGDFFAGASKNADGTVTEKLKISADGSAEFASYVRTISTDGSGTYLQIDDNEGLVVVSSNVTKVSIDIDGSATFAGNKAGITKEGYLWCTTRRGDTVILDFTSNGTGQWVEYEPTSRKDEIRDKLDELREDTSDIDTDAA